MIIGGWGLWADVGDVIISLIVLAIMVASGLSQILGKVRENRPARRPQPARPAKPAQAGGPGARGGRGAIEDEIGEFLRQAAQRRAPQAGRPPMAEVAAPKAPLDRPGVHSARGGPVHRPAARPPEPLEAQVVAPALADQRLTSAEQLGGAVAAEEEAMRERVHEAFDHELGTIAPRSGAPAAPPSPGAAAEPSATPAGGAETAVPVAAAAGFAALLGSAETVQQAIVLNEILTRPTHRWE